MEKLKANNHNIEKHSEKKVECAICSEKSSKLYLCKGLCSQIFCFQCMNRIKKNFNQCPFRCSKPFELVQWKQTTLEFSCTINPEKQTIESFYKHEEQYRYSSSQLMQKDDKFKRYCCLKGHNLFFMSYQIQNKILRSNRENASLSLQCECCKDEGLFKSICPSCSTKEKLIFYCSDCRQIPCTKQTCAYLHKFVRRSGNQSKYMFCDMCNTAACKLGGGIWYDQECDFGVCNVCYEKLPENHELVPFKMEESSLDHLISKDFSSRAVGLKIQGKELFQDQKLLSLILSLILMQVSSCQKVVRKLKDGE